MILDIIIIGAGPAGISLAAEAIHRGLPPERLLILEKEAEHSFSIRKFYPETKLVTANYKNEPAACRGVMCITDQSKTSTISYLDQAIRDNSISVHYHESVHKIIKHPRKDKHFAVLTDRSCYQARVVAIAVGILGRPNRPDYPLPGSLSGRALFDVTSADIKNSDVLVVGGGDSASEYCQYLESLGNRVTLSYRRADFERMNDLNQQIILSLEKEGRVKILRSSVIEKVSDDIGRPMVHYKQPGEAANTYDYIIYALGGTTPANFLKSIGIEYEGGRPSLRENYETNIPGLFLLGDLASKASGGSIISAFNSAHDAMKRICSEHLGCCRDAQG